MIPDIVTSYLITAFGVVQPGYHTFKALKQKTQQTRLLWLRYWVVFAFLWVIQSLSDVTLYWLPFYNEFKILMTIWLTASKASGAQLVYAYGIYPLLAQNEAALDKTLSSIKKKATTIFWQYASHVGIQWSGVMCSMIRYYLESLMVGQYYAHLQLQESNPEGNQESADHPALRDSDVLSLPIPNTVNTNRRAVVTYSQSDENGDMTPPKASRKHYSHILKPEDVPLSDADDTTELQEQLSGDETTLYQEANGDTTDNHPISPTPKSHRKQYVSPNRISSRIAKKKKMSQGSD